MWYQLTFWDPGVLLLWVHNTFFSAYYYPCKRITNERGKSRPLLTQKTNNLWSYTLSELHKNAKKRLTPKGQVVSNDHCANSYRMICSSSLHREQIHVQMTTKESPDCRGAGCPMTNSYPTAFVNLLCVESTKVPDIPGPREKSLFSFALNKQTKQRKLAIHNICTILKFLRAYRTVVATVELMPGKNDLSSGMSMRT